MIYNLLSIELEDFQICSQTCIVYKSITLKTVHMSWNGNDRNKKDKCIVKRSSNKFEQMPEWMKCESFAYILR